jgi:hypothetical protein
MHIQDLIKLFGEEAVNESTGLNPLVVAEMKRFRQRNLTGRHYTGSALDDVTKLKLPFASTDNGVRNIFRAFVGILCPYCGTPMLPGTATGAGSMWHIQYDCQACKANVCINIASDGFCAKPPETK